VTEPEWLGCTDPQTMLDFLREKASDRKLRLFACAFCMSSAGTFSCLRSAISLDTPDLLKQHISSWSFPRRDSFTRARVSEVGVRFHGDPDKGPRSPTPVLYQWSFARPGVKHSVTA
jgi:hypothetical protein